MLKEHSQLMLFFLGLFDLLASGLAFLLSGLLFSKTNWAQSLIPVVLMIALASNLLHHLYRPRRLERFTEVQLGNVPQISPVLLKDRAVEAKVLANQISGLLRGLRTSDLSLLGALSYHKVRVYPEQQEDKRGHEEYDQQV